MRLSRLIVIASVLTALVALACVLTAFVVPQQAVAQTSSQPYYGTINGTVFSQAFKQAGVTVTLWSATPSLVQDQQKATATTDASGNFVFPYVAFQPTGQFQYIVRADKGSSSAFALVYALPPSGNDTAYVAPIQLDLSTSSGTSQVTVTVWSTSGQSTLHTNLNPVPGVTLNLYTVDQATGNRSLSVSNRVTDSNGQATFNVPYGLYVVTAQKSGQYGEQEFPAYEQAVSPVVYTNMPLPSPTPTPSTTAAPSSSATPGFEGIVALAALLGIALYLRRA